MKTARAGELSASEMEPRPLDRATARQRQLRVALVHNWLVTFGGADRVLLALHELFPRAPVFVGLHDLGRLPEAFRQLDVRATWLQRVPGAAQHHRLLVPVMAFAFARLVLRGYDVVVSSSHAGAHGVSVRDALHICYCHTPMRYAWDRRDEYLAAMPAVARPAARLMLTWLRRWDWAAAQRVDLFIANSRNVADRIRRHYGRDATVIYPPVDVDFFSPGHADGRAAGEDDFYLVVGRLVPYKRADLAVEAFNHLHRALIIVGDGPERRRLEASARPHIHFAGVVSDDQLRDYYRQCRALVFPGEEDFGIVPVEAQACGRPVIAFGRGGVLESVVPGRTGVFFAEQTRDALAAAVRAFEGQRFAPDTIRAHAEQFSRQRFMREMTEFVTQAVAQPGRRAAASSG